jgi:hypothetical protein
MLFLMGRFDVSELKLNEAPDKCWSNRDGLSKHATFPRKHRGGVSNGVQQTTGCPGSRRRYSMIVDVTHSRTLLCADGADAAEGAAFSARLMSTRFFRSLFEILRDGAWTAWWDLTWRKDVLEPGERCGDTSRRRAGEGSADHDGTPSYGVATDRSGGEWRRRAASGAVVAILSHRALAARAEIRG